MKNEAPLSILLYGNQEGRQILPPPLGASMLTGQTARFMHDLVTAAASSAAAAAVTTSAAATTAATASASTTTVTTAATATTTGAGAIFAGLGDVYGKSTALMVLAVESGNGRLRLGIGSHLDEPKAFRAAGIPVGDYFSGLDSAV